MGYDPMEFFQIGRWEPGFLVILDYQYSKESKSRNKSFTRENMKMLNLF